MGVNKGKCPYCHSVIRTKDAIRRRYGMRMHWWHRGCFKQYKRSKRRRLLLKKVRV